MFKIRIGNSNIIIDAALIPLLVIFTLSGYLGMYLKIYSYILLHELSHGLMAVFINKKIGDVRITPGGMNMELEGANKSRGETALILAAGPAMNALLALAFCLLGNQMAMKANLALIFFNLLPMKPLDGYELLFLAVRSNKLTYDRILAVISKIIYLFLLLLIGYGFIIGQGSLISLISSLFILSGASKNRMEGKVMNIKNIFLRRTRFEKKGYYEGRVLTVLAATKVVKIMTSLSQDCFHFIYVLDENFNLKGILTEQQIISAVIDEKSNLSFGDLIYNK